MQRVLSALNFAYGVATTGIAAVLAALAYVGHGSRDCGLIAIPAVVFAASIFLQPRAYWILAGSCTPCIRRSLARSSWRRASRRTSCDAGAEQPGARPGHAAGQSMAPILPTDVARYQ